MLELNMEEPNQTEPQIKDSSTINMNTLLHSLTFLLALFSFHDQLPSFLSVAAARKLSSNDGAVFTVDLIHRDSLLSPQQRQRLIFGSPLMKEDINAMLKPSGGAYLMKLAIGTPSFEFMAIADTGSDLIWLQCLPCQKTKSCIPQQSPLFNPKNSSTYRPLDCNSQSCRNSDLLAGCSANVTDDHSCIYFVLYGDGLNSLGILSNDTITFPSSENASVTLPSSVFGCGYAQNGSLAKGEGLIGLGTGPSSLVSQLGSKIKHKFSYCLPPRSLNLTSKLKFGAEVTSPGVKSTPFVTKKDTGNYILTLDSVSIANSPVRVGQNVIIDSGTTLTYLETKVYNGIKNAVQSAISVKPSSNPDFDPLLCYETKENLNPPDVVFHFKGGADFELKSENIFIQVGNAQCLAIVPTEGSTFIFGNIAQVNHEVGYDLKAKQVSFAPRDCTVY